MVNRKNWSIFVGDKAYKTNFFLKFLSPSSGKRFQKDLQRLTKFWTEIILQILFIFLLLNTNLNILPLMVNESIWAIFLTMVTFYLVHKKKNSTLIRCLLLVTTFILLTALHKVDENLWLSLLIFMNGIFDNLSGLEWYKHFLLVVVQVAYFTDITESFYMLIPETFIYAIYERLWKMNWVIKDTSK